MKKHVRKLSKVAKTSYSVVIPMDLIKQLGWQERQKLTIRRYGSKIIIEDWEK